MRPEPARRVPSSAACINGGVGVAKILLATAGIGISAGIGPMASTPAHAGTPVPPKGAQAVTYAIDPTAQRAALAFWTPARMEAATAIYRTAGTPGTPPPVSASISHSEPQMPTAPKGTPTAVHFDGVPAIGALFFTTGSAKHFCTASVTDSRPGDLALTAAHCVYGRTYATNIAYVPMYHNGARPHGTWPVTSITVAAGWRTEHNPDLDFAFLKVAALKGHSIQSVTKGLALGLNGSYALAVQVVGYNDTDSQPVHCLTQSFEFRPGQLEFYCHDYWDGTSGGPWITGYSTRTGTGTVHGVIGGYQQGGRYEWASFSPYFGSQLAALYGLAQRAH
jgi:V8-like Glu-specific endopeptidase